MYDVIEAKGPVVIHAQGVMDNNARKVFRGVPGHSIRQLAPRTTQPTLCVYNGDFALPEDWDWVPASEDHVAFITLPKGNNTSRTILGVVLIVVGFIVPGAQALIYVGAALLVSGLMPAPNYSPLVDSSATSPSPTYNISLSGNTARLGQAIPVMYGRHILMPDFAAQSYVEFDENDDQFYFALLCLGQMDRFTLESIMIDDTDLSHFEEVQTQLVGPNYSTPLSLVDPAVVNAPEVASQDMEYGKYIGPFASCGPGLRAKFIGIDINCPKGLYYADSDGNLDPKTTSWFVEARSITDTGATSGDWFLIAAESLTGSTSKAIRRSYKYPVAEGRYEVRVSRQDERDENARAGHDLQWLGMRAYVDQPPPLEPSATFLAIKIRATSQLSGLSQRRISVIVERWLPAWNPTTGWSAPAATRSIAWALADALRNTDYGGRVADNRIDLQTLYELDQLWTERGDEFNGVFDKRITVWAAISAIARAGRARPIMRGSVFTFIRDSKQDLEVALFSMRNIKRNSFSIDYNMLSDDTTDGLELEYFDSLTWASATVVVKIESDNTFHIVEESDDAPSDPAKISFVGITNLAQAQKEALYIVADVIYRRASIAFTTEMEGYLPCYGDLIAVSHDIAGWGVSGDIADWDAGEQMAVCTEAPIWSVGNNYSILIGPQGDVFGPYLVTPGTEANSMVFLDTIDEDIEIYTGTERERTRFAMGPANSYSKLCRIVSITPQQGDTVQIRAVIEDNRVHSADEVVDDGGGGGDGTRIARYAPDDVPEYDEASDVQQNSYGFFTTEDVKVGIHEDDGYIYAS